MVYARTLPLRPNDSAEPSSDHTPLGGFSFLRGKKEGSCPRRRPIREAKTPKTLRVEVSRADLAAAQKQRLRETIPSPPRGTMGALRVSRRLPEANRCLPISFRTSTDIWTVENVLVPFIDFDDDSTYHDDESEKYNCLDDHFLSPAISAS
jgi:hypothetical protein